MKHTNFIHMYQLEKIQNSVQEDSVQCAESDYLWLQEDISVSDKAELLADTFEICPSVTYPMPYSRIDTGKNLIHNLIFTIIFLVIFATIRLRGKNLISGIIYAMAQRKRTVLLLNEGILPNLVFYSMGLILSFSVLAVFLSYLSIGSFFSIYSLALFGSLLFYHLTLLFTVYFLGWTFHARQIANEFIVNLWTFHIGSGLLISPFVMALFFVQEKTVSQLVTATIICLSLLMMVKIVRWFAIFFHYKVSILYMILYFCALELLPLLFLYKAVV